MQSAQHAGREQAQQRGLPAARGAADGPDCLGEAALAEDIKDAGLEQRQEGGVAVDVLRAPEVEGIARLSHETSRCRWMRGKSPRNRRCSYDIRRATELFGALWCSTT